MQVVTMLIEREKNITKKKKKNGSETPGKNIVVYVLRPDFSFNRATRRESEKKVRMRKKNPRIQEIE